ncbi:MAG: tRNA lysidine(34) synthetase TilS [Oscillospiraceae bacterium]|nr:tRNA lysidine(34) synthetase TilS [Oscillospiraceae bacterium]
MKAEFLSYCREEQLFVPGDTVICAVSGGADSVALLHLLHDLQSELQISLRAAHFNHKLRGEESDGDEAFVRELCGQWQIPLFLGSADVSAYGRAHQMGTEEAARQCRYDFFRSLDGKVATAHNAEDHLETVLMHLLRGSGLRGLCGIPPQRGSVVRPLLWAGREQIRSYLEQQGLPHREDSSNRSLRYTRNRLRHEVLPLLEKENPRLASRVLKQSSLLRREDQLLDELAGEYLQGHSEGGVLIAPLLSAPDPLQKRALRQLLGEYLEQDVALVHIEALQQLLRNPQPSACVSLPCGLTAQRCYERLEILRQGAVSFPETVLNVPGETVIPDCGWKISCNLKKNFTKMTNTPFHFAIKYDMIWQHGLSARSRQVGDRLPTADGHSKSLKKLMIERRIPRKDRELLPVLVSGDRILAVAGLAVAADCQAQEGQDALIIHIQRGETL